MGVLQGAGTGAAIGSVIPGIGTAAGAIAGGIIGLGQTIGGWISGENKEKKQREHEKEMMGLQYQYSACLQPQPIFLEEYHDHNPAQIHGDYLQYQLLSGRRHSS